METEQLPLIALRGVVVFPYMVLSFPVGRAKSLAALEMAQQTGDEAFFVKQKEDEAENPVLEDLSAVGTVGRIKQILRLPGNMTHVIVEGLYRGKLQQIMAGEECEMASFLPCAKEEEKTEDIAEQAKMRLAADLFDTYVRIGGTSGQNEAMVNVISSKNVGQIADVIAAGMQLPPEEKQTFLEEINPEARLDEVMQKLQEEIAILEMKAELEKKVRAKVEASQKEYYLREQMKVIQDELGDPDGLVSVAEDYQKKAKEKGLPEEAMQTVEQECEHLKKMSLATPEANIIRNYVELILELPWTETTKTNMDLKRAQEILDEDHYGLKEVKERVVEYLAVQETTGRMGPTILCLTGPPGVGKTSVAKSVARALGRRFVRMSLGGVKDESEIRGHRRTYVGAMCGRILRAMKRAGTINPVLLLDEVDKLSSSYQGDPAAALLEVLDGEQNHTFSDHYLEIPYDLSQVFFLCTANDPQQIPPALRDRMELIELPGYTLDEKIQIAKRYLFPKERERAGLKEDQIQLGEEALAYLAERYTREAGVRQLEQCIASLCRKVAKERLLGRQKQVRLTKGTIRQAMGPEKVRPLTANVQALVGVVRGLAWTSAGGDTLEVEAVLTRGSGKLVLTGQMGSVMQESAKTALTYVRSLSMQMDTEDPFQDRDVHIHIPEGAVPKDGPSAGVTMATAIFSAATGQKVRPEVAMTGEVTITGRVLAIGGLKEKLLAARQAGITTVLVPEENRLDIAELEKQTIQGLTIRYVKTMSDVLETALVEGDGLWK